MKNKWIITSLLILLLLIIASSALILTNFSTSNSLNFTGSQDKYINISIPRLANVTSAYFNVSGSAIYSNISKTPEANMTNTTFSSGIIQNISYANDTNWSSYSLLESGSSYATYLYFNYSLPENASNIYFITKINGIMDYGINSYINNYCYNNSNRIVSIRVGRGAIYCWWIHETGYEVSLKSGYGFNMTFYEGMINYSINSYPTNISIKINNTNVYNYSSVVNFTNNKTSTFNNILNTAITNKKCDCYLCYKDGDNCTIPLFAHSDYAGSLNLNDLQINYKIAPNITLINPTNGSALAGGFKTFNCTIFDYHGLSNVTLKIYNSTGLFNQTTTVLTGYNVNHNLSVNVSKTDTYLWNCEAYNNETLLNSGDNNFTLFIDTNNPAITLNYPSNNFYSNKANNTFNCSVDGTSLDALFLYGNFSGSFVINQTKSGITSTAINSLYAYLSDGQYLWSCGANKTTAITITMAQVGNYTLIVDTGYPTAMIHNITSTTGSQTLSFGHTANDTNLNYCKYNIINILGLPDGGRANQTINCNDTTTTAITTYGSYNISFWAIDLAGNEVLYAQPFTISASGGVINTGGGGYVQLLQENEESTADIKLCVGLMDPLMDAWQKFKKDYSWNNFKLLWRAFWNASLCESGASIIPL
jgi:hypothetical protein